MELNELPGVLAQLAQKPTVVLDGKAMVVPDGTTLIDIQQYLPNPVRVAQHVSLRGIDHFNNYVNRFKNDDTTIFITPNLQSLSKDCVLARAVIDYHVAGVSDGARHGEHTVHLNASPSQAYAKLIAIDGKFMDQTDFARFIEDIARFSSSHAAADLMEIAQTIQLTSKGDFRSFEDEFSGSVDFTYDLQVKAATQSKRVSVPTNIEFHVPLIDGTEATLVQTKFLYRTPSEPGGKVQLGIRIVDRPWLEEAAINDAARMIEAATAVPVYVGAI